MNPISKPETAVLLVGALCGDRDFLDGVSEKLAELGSCVLQSPVWGFDFTRYYERTMGPGLYRRFLLYPPGFDPLSLAEVKIRAGELEKELAPQTALSVERPLNLDPGYLTFSKLILASTKDHIHRIPIGGGIYAEVTLHFRDGSYRAWPWTYPDYASRAYIEFFNEARGELLEK